MQCARSVVCWGWEVHNVASIELLSPHSVGAAYHQALQQYCFCLLLIAWLCDLHVSCAPAGQTAAGAHLQHGPDPDITPSSQWHAESAGIEHRSV